MNIMRNLLVATALLVFGILEVSDASAQFSNDNLLDSRPPETVAVEEGDYEGLRSLLIGGSNTGVSDADGRSLLMAAASLNDTDIMELLFDYNVQIEQSDKNGSTALHWAVLSGSVEATILLLDRGASVDAQNNHGLTPLMVAVRESDRFLAEELVRMGPDLERADYTGRTALDWARTGRDRSIETLLIDAGAR